MGKKKEDVILDESGTVYVLRAGTPLYVKTADICAMTGKSNQWIGQLVSQGTLSKKSTPHGSMFDVRMTIHAYCDMLDTRKEEKQENQTETDKQNAEISIKKAKAIIATLEASEMQGKMHRSEDVSAMTEDLIYAVRGALMALPGRLALDVVGAETPAEAADVIRKEVFKIMNEISNYRYDPQKYQERVRARRSWDAEDWREGDEE